MAFIRRAFKTTGFMTRPIGYSLGRHVYVTADDVATIEAAGYFNDIAKLVQAGDHLDVTAALGSTPVRRDYVIGSVAAGVVSIIPGQGGGVPQTIVINGVTYNLLYSRTTGQYLTSRTTGEPIYGRAA